MGNRRNARESALKILYEVDIKKSKDSSEIDEILNDYWERDNLNANDDIKNFASEIVRGVLANIVQIDGYISKFTKKWDITRIDKVEKNILRIGIFEIIFFGKVPTVVSINEAIEIAKKYGAADADKFINGILDQIRKKQ